MTSCYGTDAYKDLIQTYDLADLKRYPEKKLAYDPNSVMGFLSSNQNFKIFSYLLRVAHSDVIANQREFMSTLFIADDETLLRQLGEKFFMNLDRNTAIKLLNLHILPRVVNKSTLLGRRVAVLDTKNQTSQISMMNNNGLISLISLNKKFNIISDEIKRNNGIIYVIDGFFIPENFNF
jgi:uncharacterized surface protein with fasciclin (FAS1) repeats